MPRAADLSSHPYKPTGLRCASGDAEGSRQQRSIRTAYNPDQHSGAAFRLRAAYDRRWFSRYRMTAPTPRSVSAGVRVILACCSRDAALYPLIAIEQTSA